MYGPPPDDWDKSSGIPPDDVRLRETSGISADDKVSSDEPLGVPSSRMSTFCNVEVPSEVAFVSLGRPASTTTAGRGTRWIGVAGYRERGTFIMLWIPLCTARCTAPTSREASVLSS